jgi:hypothetical protein
MKPLLYIVLVFSLLMGAVVLHPFFEPQNQTAGSWLFLGIGHLVLVAWAGVVVWWTRTHERWLNTSRQAWLVGMGLAYVVGIGGGVYVFVFN